MDGRLIDVGAFEGIRHTVDREILADATGRADPRSDMKGAELAIPFTETQIGLHGVARFRRRFRPGAD